MEAVNSPIADRELSVSRTMKAPRALAWKACTEAEHLDRWWGPDGFINKTLSLDMRVGGQWKYTMTGPDGTVFPNLITYTEISPIDLLAYDHGDWDNPKWFRGSMSFADTEDGTTVTIRLIFPSKEERDRSVEQYGAIEGGKQTLAKLDNYLRTLQTPKAMTQPAIFNFIVAKDDRTVTVERSFNAPQDMVWDAWTRAEILCQWWAPKPYACVIDALDFRPGGRWRYSMQGPEGDRHHCFFDYAEVRPKSYFSGRDGFCDEHGVVNAAMPTMQWENSFSAHDTGTLVRILVHFKTPEDLEAIIKMGFKEGFSQGLDQLDELLSKQ